MSTTKRLLVAGSLSAVLLASLAGCGAAPDEGETQASSDYLPCILSDEGGFDDRSFNQLAYEGVEAAADELGPEFKSIQSKTPSDYTSTIDALVAQSRDVIVGAGLALVAPLKEAAEKYPDTNFAIVDDNSIDA